MLASVSVTSDTAFSSPLSAKTAESGRPPGDPPQRALCGSLVIAAVGQEGSLLRAGLSDGRPKHSVNTRGCLEIQCVDVRAMRLGRAL